MLVPLEFPPGIKRAGTVYQSKGRYYDCSLMRFFAGTIQPVGGWRTRSSSAVSGVARCMIVYSENDGDAIIGIGTNTNLYAMDRGGTLTDITPAGYTTGPADATTAGGYGTSTYGSGSYGTPRPDTTNITPAAVWALDSWGQYLVGVLANDGDIVEWQGNTASDAATIANSPTASAIVVTDDRFLFALGAGGNPRNVAWSDQGVNTTWVASATNQAGSQNLQTSGKLMCGRRVRGGTLLFTDVDVHLATYTGPPFVHSIERVGSDCGVVSRQAPIVVNGEAYWMGVNGFFHFNGYVSALPSEVDDYVFSDINRVQISKVQAFNNSAYKEIWWLYPSSDSTEIDRYVIYNYGEGHWNIGALSRLCAFDRGVLQYPLMIDASGYVYEHEVGLAYSSASIYIESGPLEFGVGDNVACARYLYPDEATQGDVTATFYTKFYPNGSETTFGPYTASTPTDVRFTGRQVRVRYDVVSPEGCRIGVNRVEAVPGGLR